ncbi:hypothetical protein FMM74_022085 [Lachnospiraceae bacterium MD308]|jgi:hypothetical protein|nr:hypothetical protein [Lachnospiraceae bacterium MD308]
MKTDARDTSMFVVWNLSYVYNPMEKNDFEKNICGYKVIIRMYSKNQTAGR